MTRPSIQSAELLPDEIDPRDFLRDVRLQELLLGMYPITVTDDDLEALTALRGAALVLQRRFLNLVSFWAETASRKARPQSCQACGQVAMKRCSRSLYCEPSL